MPRVDTKLKPIFVLGVLILFLPFQFANSQPKPLKEESRVKPLKEPMGKLTWIETETSKIGKLKAENVHNESCDDNDNCEERIQGNVKISPQFSAPASIEAPDKKSVIDIQQHSTTQTLGLRGADGSKGEVQLININSNVNLWHLVKIFWPHKKTHEWFHLQAVRPDHQQLILDDSFLQGIVIKEGSKTHNCELWAPDGANLKLANYKKKPYTPLCGGRIYLRQKIEGYRTTKEWVVEFLRDNVWGGEAITELVKSTIYKDRYLIESEVSEERRGKQQEIAGAPGPAELDPKFKGKLVEAEELGIELKSKAVDQLVLGSWYPIKSQRGVFISVLEAKAISSQILNSHRRYVNKLGPVEETAMNYLIAFDLDKFDLNFALGTEHPRVGWSARVREADRDLSLPGPDGIDSVEPIANTGLIPPHLAQSVVATFTGGFKRSHGAFKWGKLSKRNFGTHYGVMENGVTFSKIQSELATLLIYQDGRVEMKTWAEIDNSDLPTIKHIRQNGVPILKFDKRQLKGVPADYVSNWTLGNWSGSADREFRTLRAGVCLKEEKGKRYLIYGYFSSVTPTAMARVFQAYGCDYAMHLDMNALEHTYLAVYSKGENNAPNPEQLVKGMKVLDERFKGNVPRFIGYPDNRDYFYLTPKEPK